MSLGSVAGCGKRSDVSAPEDAPAGWGARQTYPLPEEELEPPAKVGDKNMSGG